MVILYVVLYNKLSENWVNDFLQYQLILADYETGHIIPHSHILRTIPRQETSLLVGIGCF